MMNVVAICDSASRLALAFSLLVSMGVLASSK
jgi:hypothetical protein